MDKRATIRATGAVYTPDEVAAAIVEFISGMTTGRPVRTLEPSVGDGAFLVHLPPAAPDGHEYTLVDIDHSVIERLQERLGRSAATFITANFVQFAMQHVEAERQPFDLIIGNPPFIRKHNFSAEFKAHIEEFSTSFDYPVSDLKNAWAFFLVAAINLLSETGVIALVLPYELMTVDYGQTLLTHAVSKLARIDLFVSDNKAFKDIDQDAVIFVGRKVAPAGAGLFVNRVSSFSDLGSATSCRIALGDDGDRALELSAFLLPVPAMPDLRRIRAAAATISDYANSAPGVVSAANEYFILTEADAHRLGISEHTVPILKKGSLAGSSPIFAPKDFARVSENEPCRLLIVTAQREDLDENLTAYVEEGEKRGVNKRYKCRNRKRWYEVRLVPVERGFFFKRSHSFPRIIMNEAGVYLTDTAYGVRMKDARTMRGLCFSFYTSLTMLFAEIDGRFYGGGVLELSPTEFRGLPIVYHEPTDDEWRAFLAVHEAAGGQADRILDFGDSWLRKKEAFTAAELKMLRDAWSAVRAHRMRHGGRSS